MNKIKALLIKVGKELLEVVIKNDLETLQKIVGGNIEFYPVGNSTNLILNGEGKLIGLKGNRLIENEIICGDFLVVGDNGFGEIVSLNSNQIKKYSGKFKDPLEFSDQQVQDNIMIRVLSPEDFQSFIDLRPIPMPKKYDKGKGLTR